MYGMNRCVTYRTHFCIHENGLNIWQMELGAFYLCIFCSSPNVHKIKPSQYQMFLCAFPLIQSLFTVIFAIITVVFVTV